MSYSPKLPPDAVALRAWTVGAEDEIRNYRPIAFKKGWAGCDVTLRRLRVFGMLAPEYTGHAVDALDANGDIIATWSLTPAGLRWLRNELKLRMEPREVLR